MYAGFVGESEHLGSWLIECSGQFPKVALCERRMVAGEEGVGSVPEFAAPNAWRKAQACEIPFSWRYAQQCATQSGR
jgi:hypothetical protein